MKPTRDGKVKIICRTPLFKSLLCANLFLTFGVLSASNSSCGNSFHGKCLCGISSYDRINQFVVNCTNEGFSDTSILEHMPKEVEVLIFTGNVLVNLPWNIFGRINEYPKLRILDMSNNHIREIHGKWMIYRLKNMCLNKKKNERFSTPSPNFFHSV